MKRHFLCQRSDNRTGTHSVPPEPIGAEKLTAAAAGPTPSVGGEPTAVGGVLGEGITGDTIAVRLDVVVRRKVIQYNTVPLCRRIVECSRCVC